MRQKTTIQSPYGAEVSVEPRGGGGGHLPGEGRAVGASGSRTRGIGRVEARGGGGGGEGRGARRARRARLCGVGGCEHRRGGEQTLPAELGRGGARAVRVELGL